MSVLAKVKRNTCKVLQNEGIPVRCGKELAQVVAVHVAA